MNIGGRLALAASFVKSLSFAYAACTGDGGSANAVVADRPEYVLGQPSSVQVNDGNSVKRLFYARVGDLAVFEGDIVIGDARKLEFDAQAGPITIYRPLAGSDITPFGYMARSVLSGAQKWHDKTVPYTIDNSLGSPTLQNVRAAMKAWEDVTPIRFVERNHQNA